MSSTLRFSPSAFFFGLLPPIVFAAGACARLATYGLGIQPAHHVALLLLLNCACASALPSSSTGTHVSAQPPLHPCSQIAVPWGSGFTLKKKDFFKNAPVSPSFLATRLVRCSYST